MKNIINYLMQAWQYFFPPRWKRWEKEMEKLARKEQKKRQKLKKEIFKYIYKKYKVVPSKFIPPKIYSDNHIFQDVQHKYGSRLADANVQLKSNLTLK